MKKKMSVFICLLLIFGMLCSPLFAFAVTRTEEGEMPLLQEGDFELETTEKFSDNALGDTRIEIMNNTIYNALLDVSDRISVYGLMIPITEVGAVLSNVINDNPDLFYVSSTYRVTYRSGSNYASYIIPYYSMTKDEIEDAKTVFDYGVQETLSIVDDSMSDMQKALVIHDYICDEAAYPDITNYENKEIYHCAYGFFYDRNIVCAGYTLVYSYLMHELGIECEYVTSSSMQHAWNKIKINGNWYNADLTFDDCTFFEGENTPGSIRHHFFLKSDSFFESAEGLCHLDGKTGDNVKAVETDMDEYFWDDVISRIYVIDSKYYYMKPDFSRRQAVLTRRDLQGNEIRIGSAYNSASYSNTFNAVDSNGDTQSLTLEDILIRLAYLDGRFYIASGTNIYSQFTTGQRFLITSIPYYPIALCVRENNINYGVYGDSNLYELDKLEYFENNITTSNGEYNNYADIDYNGVVNAKDYAYIIKS